MSSSETENSSKDEKSKKHKFTPYKIKELKRFDQKEIFQYVEKLHDLLEKNEKKLRKYKDKIKKLLKKMQRLTEAAQKKPTPKEEPNEELPNETGTTTTGVAPTSDIMENIKEEDTTTATDEATAAFSFVDEIRQAAEQAQNLNGFVYEPTSGLYYDQKTGYYYNAEYGLYYDGNTGCYYKYNQEKNSFEFHSQVPVQPSETASKANDNDDDMFENYDDDEVEFDEWGVITDQSKLQQIKEDKMKLKKRKDQKHKKTTEKSSARQAHKLHKSKKRKRSHRRHTSKSDSASKSSDSDSDRSRRRKRRSRSGKAHADVEDGELSTSSGSSSSSNGGSTDSEDEGKGDGQGSGVLLFKKGSRFQDIAKKYPPSLRIIVQETNLDELKVGRLSLITFKGGSLGREGNHDVIIPDVNVSKFHLKFNYDSKDSIYKCIDLGSRNGTILNGQRMCTSKMESDPHDLLHGSILQIGQTKLLCHVHEGNSTCGLCEPGLLIEPAREIIGPVAPTVVLSHKEQLKKLQKKYGLENEKFVDSKQPTVSNYNDRAATRRIQIGSSTDKEKTQTASVTTAISSENKGFKMLSKLGWNKGEALGKTNAGLLEPINVSSNEGKKGLGCDDPTAGRSVALTKADQKKMATWRKTQERYQKADIFCDSDDSS